MYALDAYNARQDFLKDLYVTEKIGTKEACSCPAPNEDWQQGFPQEFQDFMERLAQQREPLSGGELAGDSVAVLRRPLAA